jgi:hypothetical protein
MKTVNMKKINSASMNWTAARFLIRKILIWYWFRCLPLTRKGTGLDLAGGTMINT